MYKLITLAFILFIALSSYADSINSFESIISLNEKIQFSENITLEQTSNKKYIGIPRSIKLLNDQSPNPQILEVKSNNEEVSFETYRFHGNTYSIILGNRDKLLQRGTYKYSLKFEVDTPSLVVINDSARIFEYSVNSEFWLIPINNISVTVTLPINLKRNLIKHRAYTLLAGKKDLTSTQSSIVTEDNQLVVKYHSLKSLAPGEEFYIYLEYPNINTIPSESKGITADASETVMINGKSVKIGKSVRADAQENKGQEVAAGANGATIKIDGKEIKVGKSINLNQAPPVEGEAPQSPSAKIKIGGKEFRLGNTIQPSDQNETIKPGTTTPSGKKVEVGKSIRIED